MSVASTTGVWANIDPREAVAHGADLASTHPHLLPFPLMSSPAASGTRWAADALGLAVQLLPGLPADIGTAGWRLLGGRAATAARTLDARREASRLSRAFDALGEYAESSDLPVLVSVPGPWTLTRRLGLPDESPVLGDPGARRDVLQSYAHGLLDLRERIHRVVAESPDTPLDRVRIRLVEEDLDAILTGTVPTVSGYRTLPAVPDSHVVAGLRSVLQRTGEDTILALPGLSSVRIGGKDIPQTSLVDDAGVRHVSVALRPLSSSPRTGAGLVSASRTGSQRPDSDQPAADRLAPALLRQWERLAEWTETGGGVWLRIPAGAATDSGSVTGWVETAALPWTRVGMGRSGLADFGILTGEELPTGSVPLLPEQASAQRSRTHVQMAGALARAFADQAG